MITSGKRLVTFLDSGADFGVVPYLVDGNDNSIISQAFSFDNKSAISLTEFTNIWETPYDVTDPSFDCSVNRTKGTPATQMYLINHFLDFLIAGEPAPDPAQANVTNAARYLILPSGQSHRFIFSPVQWFRIVRRAGLNLHRRLRR
jgi:hypothetical protein